MKNLSAVKTAALASLALFAFSQKSMAQQFGQPYPPSISVSGTAEIKVVPNEICITVGIETRDAQLGHAKLTSDTRVENAIKFLKQNGVKPADIQTGNFSVRPEYNYDPETGQTENVKFYVVSRQMEFKISKPEKFDDILTGLMESGVNYVNEVRLNSTKLRETRDEARRRAARAAREKADLLTAELGAKAGKVTQITESYYEPTPYYYNNMAMNQNIGMDGGGQPGGGSGDGSLSVGMISITATVQATFLIE